MMINCCFEAPMKRVSESEYVGCTNVGLTEEEVTFKYDSKTKRGYVRIGNRWKWIKPQMTPVSVGSIIITEAWPGRRVFSIYCDVEEDEEV